MRALLLLLSTLLLSACGFHLRGQAGMPFEKLYLDAASQGTPFIRELRRDLEDNKVKLVSSAGEADVVLNIVAEVPDKQILTLGSGGRVNEFRLGYKVSLRAYDAKQRIWIPAEEIVMHRDYSYDDTKILAKEAEEALLFQSMRADMVQLIVRRLSRAKPLPQ
jgi:LPS-assembly lipoprotein